MTDTLEQSTLRFVDRSECNVALTAWYIAEFNASAEAGMAADDVNASNAWLFVGDGQLCAVGEDTDACQVWRNGALRIVICSTPAA